MRLEIWVGPDPASVLQSSLNGVRAHQVDNPQLDQRHRSFLNFWYVHWCLARLHTSSSLSQKVNVDGMDFGHFAVTLYLGARDPVNVPLYVRLLY